MNRGGFSPPYFMRMRKIIDLIQSQNYLEADEYLRKNRRVFTNRDYLFFESLIFQLRGDLGSATQGYKKLLQSFPGDLGAAVNLAAIFNAQGSYAEALEYLTQCALDTPNLHHSTALFDSYFGLRQYGAAENQLAFILSNGNNAVEFLERKAAFLLQQNNIDDAITILENLAAKYGDTRPQIFGNLAAAYNRKGQPEQALLNAEKALELNPDSWQFQLNKANALMSLERLQEAKAVTLQVLENGSQGEEVLSNIARIENLLGNIEESIQYCEKGLSNGQNDPLLLCTLADNFSVIGKTEEAYSLYEKSLTIDPENPLTNWHLALTLLRDKEYHRGWNQYKWGFKRKFGGRGVYPFDEDKEWSGEDDIPHLLIWGEQGVGDVLMFSKLIKYISPRIPKVELQIDSRLVEVFKDRLLTREGVSFRLPNETTTGPHIPIGNLPAVLWSRYEADPSRLNPFFKRTAFGTKEANSITRIGIAWRGGISERMQGKRSVPLGLFRRLPELFSKNIRVVMLQYNYTQEETDFLTYLFGANLVLPAYDARQKIDLWVSHIDSCDLIISVDNSAIHFSGALGIPTLAMLPTHPDFRWGRYGSSNDWYESVRLLRNADKISLDDLARAVSVWLETTLKTFSPSPDHV